MEGIVAESMMLQHALRYARMGLSIIPVNGKIPCIKWKEFQERCASETEIKAWWAEFPTADIGMVTGPITGRLVLDIDGPIGERSIEGMPIPQTQSVRTKRGVQYHFELRESLARSTVAGILPSVDVRGLGGYCKLPPSSTSDGGRYSWLTRRGIGEVPLAPAPQWLLDLLTKPKHDPLKPEQRGSSQVDLYINGVLDGGRYHAFTVMAGFYFGSMRPDMAEKHLREWNQKNKPPMSDIDQHIRRFREKIEKGELEGYKEAPIEVRAPQSKTGATLSASELMKFTHEAEWLIDDMVPAKGLTLFSGEPEAGKTWFMLDFAIEAARGGKWLGQFPIRKSSVFYVDEERPIEFIKKRYSKLLMNKRADPAELSLHFSFQQGYKLDVIEKRNAFIRKIEELRPDIVILDSFADFHSKDENSSTGILEVYEVLKLLRNEYGCSIMIIDHDRKPLVDLRTGKQIIDADMVGNMNRGSNAKRGAVETQFSFKFVDGVTRVYHSKASWSMRKRPFQVGIIDPAKGETCLKYLGEI